MVISGSEQILKWFQLPGGVFEQLNLKLVEETTYTEGESKDGEGASQTSGVCMPPMGTEKGDDVAERLGKAFGRLEQWDLRVRDVWLHPKQIAELKGSKAYDPVADRQLRDFFIKLRGASYVGMIYGARVFESDAVLEDHVVLAPDGLDAKIEGSAACMPF
jgi:hypothetical protein